MRVSFLHAHIFAILGFDTAENEPCNVCPLSVLQIPQVREPYEAEMRMAHMRCRMQAKGYHAAPFDCPVGFQP